MRVVNVSRNYLPIRCDRYSRQYPKVAARNFVRPAARVIAWHGEPPKNPAGIDMQSPFAIWTGAMLTPRQSQSLYRAILIAVALAIFVQAWRAESSPPDGAASREVLAARAKHLETLGVPHWHELGARGAGVKVAILDTGFRGYRTRLGGPLPDDVAVRSFRRDGNLEARDSFHGILCGEVIHAIAPDAQLLFANWEPDDPEAFVEAARWCREQGARVISCSVVMPAWSDGEGGGAVHRELAGVFSANRQTELLAVACAGNLAPRHWSGQFSDNGSGYHVWENRQTDNNLTPWSSDRVSVELLGPPMARFDVEVIDRHLQRLIGDRITYRGADRSSSQVRFVPEAGHEYSVRIHRTDEGRGSFHLVALGAWLEHSTSRGSIPFPGDGTEWLTVGAIDPDGRRASYSSCGPNSREPKPDLSAPVPFPTLCRSTPFSGTSAAAPQAAGLAALIWSRHSHWNAEQVRSSLRQACQASGSRRYDPEIGFGRLALPSEP